MNNLFQRVNRKFMIFICILFLYLLFIGYISYNYSLTERFGDETAHMVGGHFVLKGKELYKDLQFNHQPLNYYFSSAVESLTSPSNLYFYISRQRLAIWAYSAVWNIILFLCFGPIILLFSFLFEISKFWFSGYKLLAEALAVYPMVFLFAALIKKKILNQQLSTNLLIIISIASFIAGFSLLPLWIVIIPINVILFLSLKDKKKRLYLVVPFLVLTGLLFMFTSPYNLYKESVLYNTKYFLPASETSRPSFWTILFYPLLSFVPPFSIPKVVTAFLVFSLLSTGFMLRKNLKDMKWWLIIFLLFIATNFFRAGDDSFNNFHLLPWFGVLLISEVMFIQKFIKEKSIFYKKIARIKIIGAGILFILAFYSQQHLIQKRDLSIDYLNQYSTSETYGRAITLIKDSDDTLIVAPNDPLIYWVADIDTNTRLLEYYPWIYPIPEYNQEVRDIFLYNPPEFFVNTGLDEKVPLEKYVLEHLHQNYTQLNLVEKPSQLYIHNKKMEAITDNQWKELNSYLFTK